MERRAVLLLESDESYADLIRSVLERDGWVLNRITSLGPIQESQPPFPLHDFTLLLVEARPAYLQPMRDAAGETPIIALTGPGVEETTLREVVSHADYDLAKPFTPRRLLAAVKATARRGRRRAQFDTSSKDARVGGLTVAAGRPEATVDGRRIPLSPREYALLSFLVAHPGIVFTREELAQHAWGWSPSADSRAVDNAVSRLRRKIELTPATPSYLLTDSGIGYRLGVP